MSVDPAAVAQAANKSTLVIQGSSDLQVTQGDAEVLAYITEGELLLLPEMNHILKDSPPSRRGNLATYSNPDLPLAEGLVEAIVDFMEDTGE
jgi:hypothetical protein